LAKWTRPDISCAVLNRIGRCLLGTKDKGLNDEGMEG
jgi:hypothetical protein